MNSPKITAVRPLTNLLGEVYLTGGGVIDLILNREIMDLDLEVYGHTLDSIADLLTRVHCGFFKDDKWGVIKLKLNGVKVDLTVPRVENKVDKGHQGFAASFPNMTPQEASSRRDFTINSMMYSLTTGELLDFWGGMDDLNDGILRPVNPDRFMEDPVRIFRAANMLARKVPNPHPVLYELAQERHLRAEVPAEAIFAELNKAMTGYPSRSFEFLERAGWSWPELSALKNLRENPKYHPEGDTFTHTLLSLDRAAEYRDHLPAEWQLGYMYGMLLHDVGKLVTMINGRAHGHDEAGVEIAQSFMEGLRAPRKLIDQVAKVVKYHMRGNLLFANQAKRSAYRRLSRHIPLEVLGYVAKADSLGRLNAKTDHPASERCFSLMDDPVVTEPLLKGRHLIQMGMTPGPHFSEILEAAYDLQMEGMDFDSIYKEIERLLDERNSQMHKKRSGPRSR